MSSNATNGPESSKSQSIKNKTDSRKAQNKNQSRGYNSTYGKTAHKAKTQQRKSSGKESMDAMEF